MSDRDDYTTDSERSLLCRFGLHKWSKNRGGIKVCLRSECRKARTYGLTGTMRKMQFEEDLYEDYQRYVGTGSDQQESDSPIDFEGCESE
jgi:hypothetical protein